MTLAEEMLEDINDDRKRRSFRALTDIRQTDLTQRERP